MNATARMADDLDVHVRHRVSALTNQEVCDRVEALGAYLGLALAIEESDGELDEVSAGYALERAVVNVREALTAYSRAEPLPPPVFPARAEFPAGHVDGSPRTAVSAPVRAARRAQGRAPRGLNRARTVEGGAAERDELLRQQIKEELRLLYHLDDRALAPDPLKAWLASVRQACRTIRRYRDGILAAIRLGLSHGGTQLEVQAALTPQLRLHGPQPLIALI